MGDSYMKVSVRNLGVIKEAEFDVKPFTVFIGPNNAGKTWLAYALAGILDSHLNRCRSIWVQRPHLLLAANNGSPDRDSTERRNARIPSHARMQWSPSARFTLRKRCCRSAPP